MKLIVVRVSPDVAPKLHDDKIDIIHFRQEVLDIIYIYIYIYIERERERERERESVSLIISSKDKQERADRVKDYYKTQNIKANEIQYT
jgi:hypothetical protein